MKSEDMTPEEQRLAAEVHAAVLARVENHDIARTAAFAAVRRARGEEDGLPKDLTVQEEAQWLSVYSSVVSGAARFMTASKEDPLLSTAALVADHAITELRKRSQYRKPKPQQPSLSFGESAALGKD